MSISTVQVMQSNAPEQCFSSPAAATFHRFGHSVLDGDTPVMGTRETSGVANYPPEKAAVSSTQSHMFERDCSTNNTPT